MNEEACLEVINKINNYLKKNLWMDFEICIMDGWEIVLSGKLDELDDELIEISFLQPFMVSCLMSFSYEDGEFISLIQGMDAVKMNKNYNVEKGNHIFKLSIDNNESEFFVIAKEIKVNICEQQ